MSKKRNIVERRYVSSVSLRGFCVTYNLCTCCDDSQYERVFDICHKDRVTSRDIVSCARLILLFSDLDSVKGGLLGCCDNDDDRVCILAWSISRMCSSTFFVKEA